MKSNLSFIPKSDGRWKLSAISGLDNHYPGEHSWTLALLVAGLVIGCWNAWKWVTKEEKAMRDEQEDKHE